MGKQGPTFFEFEDPALKRFNEIEAEALPFAGRYLNCVVAIVNILA